MNTLRLDNYDCICKAIEVNSPIQNKFRGWRLVAVVPNLAGRKMFSDEPKISFSPKYRILEEGDWMHLPTDKHKNKFEQKLINKFSKFQKILWIND